MVHPAEPGFKPAVPARPRLAPLPIGSDCAGDALRVLMRASVVGDRVLARRLRLYFRRTHRLDVTIGTRAELQRAVEAGDLLDDLIVAARSKKFAKATAAVELLRKAFGVNVVPLDSRAIPEWGAAR